MQVKIPKVSTVIADSVEQTEQTINFAFVATSKAAGILACALRGHSHESLACLSANLIVALQRIRDSDGTEKWWNYQGIAMDALSGIPEVESS
jgi:hypothetical protein